MATLAVIVNGVSTTISGGTTSYRVFMDGAGIPPIRRLTERGATQQGAFDLGYRVDMRTIRLVLAYEVSSASAAVTRRDAIYGLFAPTGVPIQLRETRDDASVRQIDCHVSGVMDMPQSERTEGPAGQLQRFLVTLQAADPFWYDPTVGSAATTSSTVGWQLANGQIASGAVAEASAAPTQGQNITAGNFGDADWSIGLRTAPAAAGTQYIFDIYQSVSGDMGNRIRLGRIYYEMFGGPYLGIYYGIPTFSGTSTQNVIITYHSSSKTTTIYRDGTQIFTGSATVSTVFDGALGKKWRSDYAGSNTWTAALTRAAIYNITLNSTQVAALNSTLTSGDTTAYAVTVAYTGSADEYPILALAGPITSPVITNGLTGTTLDFTGYTIADGTTLYIDLRYGYKTVQDSTGVNRIDKLTNASSLAAWRLAPGNNGIALGGSGTGANTRLSFSYYKRYWAA